MNTSDQILRKVGTALLAFGLVDMCVMIYCITQQISYSSSFNLFAVVAGIFLLKGSARTARIVTFFSGFMLTGFLGLLIIFPFLEPFELRAITFKQNPITTLASYLFMPLVVFFVYWVYKNLISEPVMTARKEAGMSYGTPKLALALGAILMISLSVMMYYMNNGSNAQIAKNKAQEQLGESYKFHITAMQTSGNYVHTKLIAYRDNEIKEISVEWEN